MKWLRAIWRCWCELEDYQQVGLTFLVVFGAAIIMYVVAMSRIQW